MVSLRFALDSTCDKVIQILGLKNESIETVISNVLVNFYGLKISSDLYKEKFSNFCKKARSLELKSLMKIPLMLTASCLVWNEEGDSSNEIQLDKVKSYFITFFYLKLKEITITRAENKYDIVSSFLVQKRQNPNMSLNVPSILLGFQPIIDFIEIVKPVGRLALQDLVSDEPHLVFPRNKLEREIGESKVELALKAGILSQTKAPGLSYQQRVSVSFYHKSIQEFMAALYMTCGDTEALVSFRSHCNTVDMVMELSNMIMFVCGLDPAIGCQLSEHAKNVVNGDVEFIQYREKQDNNYQIKELYRIQCKWFSEMKQNLSYIQHTDCTPTLHVTDVFLDDDSDDDNVSVASELVSMEDNSIVCVYLCSVRRPVHSIIRHLPGCKHLTALYIRYFANTQKVEPLVKVLPQLVQLQCVEYGYSYHGEECSPTDTAIVRAIQHLPSLRSIKLSQITLTDTVTLPPMLETVELFLITNAHFILPSVCECIQLKSIKLESITLTDTVTLPPQLQKVKLRGVHHVRFILPSLPGCPHLSSLHIEYLDIMQDCNLLASVLPQLPYLQFIHYNGFGSDCASAGHVALASVLQHLTQLKHKQYLYYDDELYECGPASDTAVVSALQHLTQLRHIELSRIDLGDGETLLVTPHMTQLQKVKLWLVQMTARRWTEFLSSLHNVHHTVHVTLVNTNIDRDTVNTIHNSPNLTVTKKERGSRTNRVDKIEFHTVQ